MPTLKILIADDHAVVRKGLKQILLEEFLGAEVDEVANATQLLQAARAQAYNVIISDLSMPGSDGLETLKQLKHEFPDTPVLILSMHPEDQYAVRVLKAGASGYLTKESAPADLAGAVQLLLQGRKYISPVVAELLAQSVLPEGDAMPHQLLSDREFEVMKMLAAGKSVSDVSNELALGVTTVSTYRSRILAKMNMGTNADLTRYAVRNGLI